MEGLIQLLHDLKICVDICTLGEPLAPTQDVISVLDLQEPTIHGMSETTFKVILGYLQTLKEKMLWVTRASQVKCKDPRASMILGLARTARNELSARLMTVEVDNVTPSTTAAHLTIRIFLRGPLSDLAPDSMSPDWEYAIVDGEVLVPRAHWTNIPEAFSHLRTSAPSTRKQLAIETPGLLHTLGWTENEIDSLADDEVLVETRAVGLNFRVRRLSPWVFNWPNC